MGIFDQLGSTLHAAAQKVGNFISPQLSQMPSPVPQQQPGMFTQLGNSGRQILSNIANTALMHPQNVVPFTAQTDPAHIISQGFNNGLISLQERINRASAPFKAPVQQAQILWNKNTVQPLPSQVPLQQAAQAVNRIAPTTIPSATPTRSISPTASPIPTIMAQVQQAVAQKKSKTLPSFQEFEKIAVPILQKYGIPPEVGIGQAAAETKPGDMGWNRNNFYNIAAYDSNPNNAVDYATPEQGIEAYGRLMSGQFRHPDGSLDLTYLPAYQLRDNPAAMLQKIAESGYAGDPATYESRTTAINPITKEKYKSYPQFVMDTPQWRKYTPNKKLTKK